MIDIYGSWIDRFGIDGFRIDTAKHVNPEFWRRFVPAMLDRAKAKGIPNFHIFGEVTAGMDPGYLARWTKIADYPAVLDFAFMNAVIQTVARTSRPACLSNLFEGDVLYAKEEATADILPTFLGNHDHGRFARDVREANPNASDAEILKRVELGHAMLLTLRGVPTIYSGDEQGFAGDGNDQDAREDMFASKVASYNDNKLVGTSKTTATDSFVPTHPLYREIATLARLRTANPALTRGGSDPRARRCAGLFASRASIPPRARISDRFQHLGQALNRPYRSKRVGAFRDHGRTMFAHRRRAGEPDVGIARLRLCRLRGGEPLMTQRPSPPQPAPGGRAR